MILNVTEEVQEIFKTALGLLKPPSNLTVDEWADQNRVLVSESSKETGKWETSRTPYMLEVYKSITKNEVRQITLMMASQMAKSEFIINTFGRYADLDPCPMLLVQPTDTMAKAFSKERIEPAIRECKVLNKIIKEENKGGKGDTVTHKKFKGGYIAFTGTGSPANLAARPIRIAFMDEVDRYAKSSGKEGRPVTLIKKRLTTYGDMSKCLITGTPTIKGDSVVEDEYSESSQAEWNLSCPHCGKHQALKFSNLKWENEDPETTVMECESCGKRFSEKEWKKGNQKTGLWVHKHPERVSHLGYHLNALASVFRKWSDIVKEFLEVKDDKEKLKAFINTVLAETWEEEVQDKLDYQKLYKRREKYTAELPDEVILLTAGIDVQNDWIVIEVVGFAENGDRYGIEYKIFRGNPEEPYIWAELDLYLKKEFKYSDGTGLNIFASCIDTGGNHTQAVYDFVSPRQNAMRLIGIKGQGGDAIPVNNKFRRTADNKIDLLSVGVNALKDLNYGLLRINKKGQDGYCHFPNDKYRGYDIDYFMSLTAEVKTYKDKKVEWIKIRPRNEGLDCRNYATVPLYVFNIDLKILGEISKEQRQQYSKYGNILQSGGRKVISRGFDTE